MEQRKLGVIRCCFILTVSQKSHVFQRVRLAGLYRGTTVAGEEDTKYGVILLGFYGPRNVLMC